MSLEEPKHYVGKRHDGVWDAELKRLLQSEAENDRAKFLAGILVLQEIAKLSTRPWFDLAKSVLKSPGSFEKILRAGLGVADASTIRQWLEFSVVRLGCRQLIRILSEEEVTRPEQVALTLYWLPSLAKSPSERLTIDEFLASRRFGFVTG